MIIKSWPNGAERKNVWVMEKTGALLECGLLNGALPRSQACFIGVLSNRTGYQLQSCCCQQDIDSNESADQGWNLQEMMQQTEAGLAGLPLLVVCIACAALGDMIKGCNHDACCFLVCCCLLPERQVASYKVCVLGWSSVITMKMLPATISETMFWMQLALWQNLV